MQPSKRRLFAMLLTLALTTGVPGAPVAAQTPAPPPSLSAAIRALQGYGVVDTKPEADLRLNDTISRAEMAKVLAAALKLQQQADAARSTAPFPDLAGHWAAGWVAVARDRGLFKGRDDGLFHPGDPVTYAEVITALLRLVGRGPEAAADWPWGAITAAADLNMLPADMGLAGHLMEPASRGNVFRLTAIAAGRIAVAGSTDTVLQSVQDRTPPVLDLTAFPTVTGSRQVTVNGKATDALTVAIGDQSLDVQPDGSFSTRLDLDPGDNAFTVLALDGAGNRAEGLVHIRWLPMSRLAISPAVINTTAGQSFTPTVLRYDATGQALPAGGVTWTYDTSAFSRDAATGTFKAARPGEYVLKATVEGVETTASVIVSGEPAQVVLQPAQTVLAAGGAPQPVTVRLLDQDGRLVTAGSYSVQLSTVPAQAVTFDAATVTTKGGEAVFYVAPGTTTGGVGLQAQVAGGRQPIQSALVPLSIEQRRFAGIQLTPVPPNVVPGTSQQVQVVATAVDQNGSPIPVRDDVTVRLSSSDTAILQLTRNTAVIRAGTSASDAFDQNGAGVTWGSSGSARISGQADGIPVTAGALYAVDAGSLARLDAQVIRGAATADGLSAALVAVTRRDAAGKVVANDHSPVVLLSPTTGASISPFQDGGGVTLFAVRSTTAGHISLTAGVPGRPELNSTPVSVAMLPATAGAVRPLLKTSATAATAGSTISAYVVLDSNGKGAVANPGPPLSFNLTATGGTLTAAEVTIPTGATRSKDVIVNIPADARSVSLGGNMVGGANLAAASVSVAAPPVVKPDPVPAGTNLTAVAAQGSRPPTAGEEVRFLVQARNGGTVQSGSYAFGLKVLLNGVAQAGFPNGLTVRAGPQPLVPADTVRTTDGEAELWVQYMGTGTIELQPTAVNADVTAAYDRWGVAGAATNTLHYLSVSTSAKVSYTAGPIDHMFIQASPNLGDDRQAMIKAAPGRFATVRLAAVDAYDNPTGNSCVATLSRISGAPDGALALRSAAGDLTEQSLSIGASGYADFNVYANSDSEATSTWSPMIVCGSTPLTTRQTVTVTATVHSAPTPTIEFAGGNKSGAGFLKAGDDYLQLRIALLPGAPDTAELLVYDDKTMIGRYGPVQGQSTGGIFRTINIPKTALTKPDRLVKLAVRIHSGAAVSEQSLPFPIYWSSQP